MGRPQRPTSMQRIAAVADKATVATPSVAGLAGVTRLLAADAPTLRHVGELWLGDVRERARMPASNPDALLPRTARDYEVAWRRVEALGGLDLPATEETARHLLERCPEGCRNSFGGALSAAYHHAGRGHEVASGRYWRYRPPRSDVDPADYIEAAELASAGLQAALDRGRKADISVALAAWMLPFTGARVGELTAARRCDLGEGRLRLSAKRSERWIPLAAHVEAVVQACAPWQGEWLFPGRGACPHIGVTAVGHALRRWGAPSPLRIRRLFASWLIDAGVPITTVAALLGHVSPETTLRHYARPTALAQISAAERVAEALARGQLPLPGFAANAHPLLAAPTMQRATLKPSRRRAAGGRGR